MKLPPKTSRLDLVKSGVNSLNALPKRGRFIVSIHKLVEDPDNERRTFRGMEGLIASVQAHGIIEPITVTPEGEQFRILTGHRRYRAARAAGLTEIEVIARDPDDALTRRRKSIISNVQREDIGAIEMAEALQTLLDEDQTIRTQRKLAELIGKRESWVSDMLRVLSIPAKLQEELRTSEISVGYDSIMRIARSDDPALQRELVDAVLAGETNREIRSRIAERKPASAGKRGASEKSKSDGPTTLMFTFSETNEGCTATVRGPEGKDSRRHMRTAVKRLLKSLR